MIDRVLPPGASTSLSNKIVIPAQACAEMTFYVSAIRVRARLSR
ncbi:MAG: hypothetical protein [Olavius algarvensis Gamma 3 endosymbiont]|nr:MAG: hypothetical protein [Olavius algarvensis Gamma 3 endosymbiont]